MGTPGRCAFIVARGPHGRFGVPVGRVDYPESGHAFIQEDWQDVFERILAFIGRHAEGG
jgi:dipeptidyl aminopeptidase/acylaminoacyl peptidase